MVSQRNSLLIEDTAIISPGLTIETENTTDIKHLLASLLTEERKVALAEFYHTQQQSQVPPCRNIWESIRECAATTFAADFLKIPIKSIKGRIS